MSWTEDEELVAFIKQQMLLMLPFFYTTVMYFALTFEEPKGEIWTTIVKCFPIVSLMIYVLSKGFSFTRDTWRRSQRIIVGLLFSCIGDGLLNNNQFIIGMISFGIAHLSYISAFGRKPTKWGIAIAVYIPVAIFCIWLHPHLDLMLKIGIPIYSALIATMLWRAITRAAVKPTCLSIFCAMGAVLFLISDALIAVTMFAQVELENKRIWIMSTYYLAQFAIALSTATEGQGRVQKIK